MFAVLRKYVPVFLLSLMLLPQAAKSLHEYQHRNDFHCDAKQSHLHVIEHVCPVCDFYFSCAVEPATLSYHFVANTFPAHYAVLPVHQVANPTCQTPPLRGPPVSC